MTAEPPRLSEALEGFVALARGLGAFVGEQTLSIARRIDEGTFDANVAAASAAKFAVLPVLAAGAFVRELADAAAIMTMPVQGPSDPVRTTLVDPKPDGTVRFLALAGPLVSADPNKPAIPVDRITIVPSRLEPNEAESKMRIPSIPGAFGAFTGDVNVSATEGGPSLRTISVLVVIT